MRYLVMHFIKTNRKYDFMIKFIYYALNFKAYKVYGPINTTNT